MKNNTSLLAVIFFSAVLSACSGGGGTGETISNNTNVGTSPTTPQRPFNPTRASKFSPDALYGMKTESGMNGNHVSIVSNRLRDFHSEPFTSDSSVFQKVFGGSDNVSVIDFISERTQLIVSSSNFNPQNDFSYSASTEVDPTGSKEASVLAMNWGADVALITLLNFPKGGKVSVRGAQIPVKEGRLGLIYLADGYFQDRPFLQVATLAHEGRHSDCTDGMNKQEAQAIADACKTSGNNCENAFKAFKGNHPQCGHAHSKCADGPLKGLDACDGHEWGSYAVGAVFYAAMEKYCEKNCSEKVYQQIAQSRLDAYSRLDDLKGFLAGKWSEPNMAAGKIETQ